MSAADEFRSKWAYLGENTRFIVTLVSIFLILGLANRACGESCTDRFGPPPERSQFATEGEYLDEAYIWNAACDSFTYRE